MKRQFAAAAVCLLMTACGSGAAEEVLIDEIETEEDISLTTELSSAETSAASESETETHSETTAASESKTETPTETTAASESKTETPAETTAASESKTEIFAVSTAAFGDKAEKITDFNMTLTYGSSDGQTPRAEFFNISEVSERVYRATVGEAGGQQQFSYVTDNMAAAALEKLKSLSVVDESGTDDICCQINVKYADGTASDSLRGSIPEGAKSLAEEIRRLAETGFDDEDFNNMHTEIQFGISRAVDVYACLSSNLDRYGARDGDAALYAGKTLVFKSREEINEAADLLENEPVMQIAEDWDGYAAVKFGDDGKIEYVNWSEEESGLSEEQLTYDDSMVYYIENGKVVASNSFIQKN